MTTPSRNERKLTRPKPGRKTKAVGASRRQMRREGKRSQAPSASSVTGGFTKNVSLKTFAGTEDAEEVLLNWDYVAALSGLGAAASIAYAVKGGSIYQPGNITTYGFAQTTNPTGYARMYTQYRRAIVISSQLEVTTSALNGAITTSRFTSPPLAVPLMVAATFADTTTAGSYAASYTATDLAGIPHAVSQFQLPGKGPATLVCRGNTGVSVMGTATFDPETFLAAVGSTSAASGADPSNNFYYVIAITNSSSLIVDLMQLRIRIKYRVRFFDPVAAQVQVDNEPTLNFDGKMQPVPARAIQQMGLRDGPQTAEEKKDDPQARFLKGMKMMEDRLSAEEYVLVRKSPGTKPVEQIGAGTVEPARKAASLKGS